jgi:hypothetical protein
MLQRYFPPLLTKINESMCGQQLWIQEFADFKKFVRFYILLNTNILSYIHPDKVSYSSIQTYSITEEVCLQWKCEVHVIHVKFQ